MQMQKKCHVCDIDIDIDIGSNYGAWYLLGLICYRSILLQLLYISKFSIWIASNNK